jgi:cytoskeletal protein CcmA (bactofilin family)
MARQILFHRSGSVLPVVLIFSIIAAITVIAFVSGQYMIARPAFIAPTNYQALLNARSGIWKGLELLNKPKVPDTLKGINTLAPGFGDSTFGKPTEELNKGLQPDGATDTLPLFSSDSFGNCELTLSYRGCFEVLQSKGIFRNSKKNIYVTLGGVLPTDLDTVLYLENKTIVQSPISGKVHYGPSDTAGTVRDDGLNKFLSYFQNETTDSIDTLKPALPLLIQNNAGFDTIPNIVKGPFFIDGSHFDLSWKTKKRIVVLGDLQITGTVSLEGMDFLVAGEIKLFDKARLRNVFLFSTKAITIRNSAVFSGSAVTQSNIIVLDEALVENRSMLVVLRKAGPKRKKTVFSATFSGSSFTDATVVALGDSLGIKIDRGAKVKGMLWTRGTICLDGKVSGIIHASKFVDGALAMAGKPLAALSVIHGTVLPFDEASSYYFPFFMGRVAIIERREE